VCAVEAGRPVVVPERPVVVVCPVVPVRVPPVEVVCPVVAPRLGVVEWLGVELCVDVDPDVVP
jgi:hypothetical protein